MVKKGSRYRVVDFEQSLVGTADEPVADQRERTNIMEEEILQLLQQSPGTPFSAKEVGKRLDREQYRENSNWARPILEGLLQQKRISTDASGYYIFKVKETKKLGEIS